MIRRKSIVKVMSILVVLAYVLNIYQLSITPFTLGELAMMIVVLLSLILKMGERTKRRGWMFFVTFYSIEFVYACIYLLAESPDQIDYFWRNWVKIITIVYICDVASMGELDSDVLQRWIVRVGAVLAASLLVQAALDIFLNIQVFPYLDLKFLPINYDATVKKIIQAEINESRYLGYFRYCTIFPEPAYFARYTLLSLIVAMFGKGGGLSAKERAISSAMILTAIFVGRSANGIFTAVAICAVWALPRRRMSAWRGLFLIVVVSAAVVFLVSTDFMTQAFERLESVTANTGTTGTQRLLQGLAVYARLPLFEKLFGVGFGNVTTYMIEQNITTAFIHELGDGYMNVFSRVLVAGGLFGFIAYMLILVKLFISNKSAMNRVVMLLLFLQFATSDLFYECIVATYFAFIQCSPGIEAPMEAGERRKLPVRRRRTLYSMRAYD